MSSSPLHQLFDSEYPHVFDDSQSLYDSDIMRDGKVKSECSKTYTTLQPARPQQYRAMTATHSFIKSPFLSGSTENIDLLSWKTKHPEFWTPREVLDWLYFFAEHAQVDCQKLRGENFQSVTGPMLCAMTREDFLEREPEYGNHIYDLFHQVLANADFIAPRVPSTFAEDLSSDAPTDLTYSSRYHTSDRRIDQCDYSLGGRTDSLMAPERTTTVAIGDHVYDIDLDTQTLAPFLSSSPLPQCFSSSTDDGYVTGSDAESAVYDSDMACSEVFESQNRDYFMMEDIDIKTERFDDYMQMTSAPVQQNLTEVKKVKRQPGRPKKVHGVPDMAGTYETTNTTKKRNGSGSKGNHLWEFIRDTLKNPLYNPKLIKWENHAEGVFKFVQSEAVAQMWGQKKNNPAMTYEKLSRAMRFCRTAGYFTDVPKNGKYPKKLCFKFGKKAHGWQ